MANEAAQAILTGLQQKLGILQQGSKTKTYLRTKMGDDIGRAIENIGIDVSKLLTERKAEKERKEVAQNKQAVVDFILGGGTPEEIANLSLSKNTIGGAASAADLQLFALGQMQQRDERAAAAKAQGQLATLRELEIGEKKKTALYNNPKVTTTASRLLEFARSNPWGFDTDTLTESEAIDFALAGAPGVDELFAGLTPEEKQATIEVARGGTRSPEQVQLGSLRLSEAALRVEKAQIELEAAKNPAAKSPTLAQITDQRNTAVAAYMEQIEDTYNAFVEDGIAVPRTRVADDILSRVKDLGDPQIREMVREEARKRDASDAAQRKTDAAELEKMQSAFWTRVKAFTGQVIQARSPAIEMAVRDSLGLTLPLNKPDELNAYIVQAQKYLRSQELPALEARIPDNVDPQTKKALLNQAAVAMDAEVYEHVTRINGRYASGLDPAGLEKAAKAIFQAEFLASNGIAALTQPVDALWEGLTREQRLQYLLRAGEQEATTRDAAKMTVAPGSVGPPPSPSTYDRGFMPSIPSPGTIITIDGMVDDVVNDLNNTLAR